MYMPKMSEKYADVNTGGCSKNRKIKISHKIQLLPSKILLENLISDYNNKMQLNSTSQNKSETAKSQHNCPDKTRSRSSSSQRSVLDLNTTWQQRRRSNSISSTYNYKKVSPNIVVFQNITIKPPLWKMQKTAESLAGDRKSKGKGTNFERSMLLDLKMDFIRSTPYSAPATSTTKFEFDFDEKKTDDNVYVKKIVNINRDHVSLSSKVSKAQHTVYFKNKLYTNNQNVNTSTTTNLRKNNFNTPPKDRFNTCNNNGTSDSNTDNEVVNGDFGVTFTKREYNIVNNNTYAASTSAQNKLPVQNAFNIQVDENENYIIPGRRVHQKLEETISEKGHGKDASYSESNISSNYVSSTFNEAFLTNSSLKLDASCQEVDYLPMTQNCIRNKDGDRDICKKTYGRKRDCNKISNLKKYNHILKLPYTGDIYTTEYLEDIFENIRRLERKLVLNDGFLNKHNSDEMCRSEIVNWMLRIQQTELYYTESEFYLAVYMLDKVLANIYIPIYMYQLLALSTIWIATKLIGIEEFNVITMVNLTNGAHSKKQLLEMEERVLKVMNFELHTAEPSVCVWYYLRLFNLDRIDLGRLSAFYALDFFALLPEFSSTPMSLLAAAVINFVQNIYHESSLNKVNTLFKALLSKEDIEKIESIERKLYTQLRNMSDENYIFKEPYRKYEGEDLMSISKYMRAVAFKYPT